MFRGEFGQDCSRCFDEQRGSQFLQNSLFDFQYFQELCRLSISFEILIRGCVRTLLRSVFMPEAATRRSIRIRAPLLYYCTSRKFYSLERTSLSGRRTFSMTR